ncbi:MAG: hypothetical protein ACE37F_27940 [Nannocystaceae bacterium]|nr:hypothetical protein [bacterium]
MLTASLLLVSILVADPNGTPSLTAAPRPAGSTPRQTAPELLYINFEGAVLQKGCGNDPHFNCSTLAETFDGYVGPYTGNTQQRLSILQATRQTVAEYGVRVVTRRPPDDVDYTMVIYGDLGEQSFAGVAPYIDCEDLNLGDTSFTAAFTGSNTGSTVILQEAAHTWGLEHVDSELDVMNPFKSAGLSQSFVDDCLPIVANTALERTPGTCNQIHTQFCDPGFQNSHREMLLLFGEHEPDVEPPLFELVYPPDASTFVLPTTFVLRGTIEDELHPQFYDIAVFNNGEPVGDERMGVGLEGDLELVITDPEPGEYAVRVVLTDEGGNASEDTVRFTILPEGSELPEDDEGEATPEGAEACALGGRGGDRGLMLALVVLATWRRRR